MLKISVRAAHAAEREAFATGCDDGRCHFRPDFRQRTHIFDLNVSALLDACVHYSTVIDRADVVCDTIGDRIPVSGCEVIPEAFVDLDCGAVEPLCPRAQLVESRECGIEVCLVEKLAAVDPIALEREDVDHTQFEVETLVRSSTR
ncbi:MAG TPA: hypothetical protein VHT50_16585 [Mycobacterium sp.]|nr:hypothetical protein [Mycobacterium sp.]